MGRPKIVEKGTDKTEDHVCFLGTQVYMLSYLSLDCTSHVRPEVSFLVHG